MPARANGGAGPVRLAVIGAGWVGAKHARLAAAQADCELVAICDAAADSRALAQTLGAQHYDDYRALIDRQPLDGEALDGVVVATPTASHAEIGIACAERGLHLLIEKPIAADLESAHQLVDAAARNGVTLAIGHHRRFSTAVGAAREIVRGGEIGRLVGFHGFWMLLKEPAYFKTGWRSGAGAGPVMINLSHDIDCLRTICGDIASVRAIVTNSGRGGPVEDTAALLLELEGGAVGTVLASDAAPSPWSYEATTGENSDFFQTGEACYYFFGTEGALAFPRLELWRYEAQDAVGWRQPIARQTRMIAPVDPLAVQMAHFCRVVAGLEAPRVDGRDATKTLASTLAILAAGAGATPVRPADGPGADRSTSDFISGEASE